jgi:hypothetical protein
LKDKTFFTMPEIYDEIDKTIENIKFIGRQEENWTNKFSDGISILGGELFYMTDPEYKRKMMELFDVVIEEVLKKSPNPNVKFSTVTNGYYDPENLLFPVVDKIVDAVGISHVDVNMSYDLWYRFKDEAHAKRVRDTVNAFHDRYNYTVGVQMILTQNLIDKMLYEGWRPKKFTEEYMPGNQLCLLYPHPIHRGNGFSGAQNLEGFNFTRSSFIKAMQILRTEEPKTYESFYRSTHNSAVYKYTMLYEKKEQGDAAQLPKLSDGKEIANRRCGHSILYQCYSDTRRCMLCDLEAVGI